MKNPIIVDFERSCFKDTPKHPEFRPGDTIRVHYKVLDSIGDDKENKGPKYRLQPFEGVVLRYKKGTVDSTFVVRKIGANSVGVERSFPICSPHIDHIDVLARGAVRRARLYYLRERSGKSARIRSRFVKKSDSVGSGRAEAPSQVVPATQE